MGVKIQIESEEVFANEDRSWLGARKGTDTCRSITLNPVLFIAAHVADKGALPSGTVLGKVTATGLYGPYDADAVNGLETAAGLLFSTTVIDLDTDAPVGAALLWEGIVKQSKLPAFAGTTDGEIDAAARTDLPTIRWEA